MAKVVALLLVLALAWYLSFMWRRRNRGLVAKRGISVGADLGTLADQPRVRVRSLATLGPDRAYLVLRPESAPQENSQETAPDLDFVVFLREDEFGFELLREWKQSQRPLALVIPPGSQLVRLRSIDDLQPLTLRRVDEE